MSAARRSATVIGLALAVIVGASLPASAEFADTASVGTTVGTLTVAPATSLVLDDRCTLTTTRTETTVDPVTGATSTSTSSTTTSTTTVVHDDTTTVSGNTTTTVSRRTTLHVSLSWTGSASRGVNGYAVVAKLADGSTSTMGSVIGTSMSGRADARYTWYGVTLIVRASTDYGWTADSVPTRQLTCA